MLEIFFASILSAILSTFVTYPIVMALADRHHEKRAKKNADKYRKDWIATAQVVAGEIWSRNADLTREELRKQITDEYAASVKHGA